jgi:hypothetical protein
MEHSHTAGCSQQRGANVELEVRGDGMMQPLHHHHRHQGRTDDQPHVVTIDDYCCCVGGGALG